MSLQYSGKGNGFYGGGGREGWPGRATSSCEASPHQPEAHRQAPHTANQQGRHHASFFADRRRAHRAHHFEMMPTELPKHYRLESALVTVDRLEGTASRQLQQIELEKVGARKQHRPASPRGSRPWLRAKAKRDQKKAVAKAIHDREAAEIEAKEREIFEAAEAERRALEEAEALRIAEEQMAKQAEEEKLLEAIKAAEDPNTSRGAWALGEWTIVNAFLTSSKEQRLERGGFIAAQLFMSISKGWRNSCQLWCKDMEHLDFCGGSAWDSCKWGKDALLSVTRSTSKVRSLHLKGLNGVALSQLHVMSEQLEELTFELCTEVGATLETNQFPRLHSLQLIECRDVTPDGLTQVASTYHGLRSLHLEGSALSGTAVLSFARNLPDDASSGLRSLYCDQHLSDEIIRALTRRCPLLENLTLHDVGSACPIKQPAVTFSHLRSLQLRGGIKLASTKLPWTDIDVEMLAKGCLELTQLRLENGGIGCKITGASLSSFRVLSDLSLTHVLGGEISHTAMAAFAQSNGLQLRRLDLSGSKLEGDAVLTELVTCCVKLEHLELSGIRCEVTDNAFPSVACTSLKYLGISSTNFASGALTSLVQACNELSSLDLRFTKTINDAAMAAIRTNAAPRLTRLDLEGCEGSSRDALRLLLQECVRLDLIGPDGVRRTNVEALVDAYRGVDPTVAALLNLAPPDIVVGGGSSHGPQELT